MRLQGLLSEVIFQHSEGKLGGFLFDDEGGPKQHQLF